MSAVMTNTEKAIGVVKVLEGLEIETENLNDANIQESVANCLLIVSRILPDAVIEDSSLLASVNKTFTKMTID
jgi:hypothetical protein